MLERGAGWLLSQLTALSWSDCLLTMAVSQGLLYIPPTLPPGVIILSQYINTKKQKTSPTPSNKIITLPPMNIGLSSWQSTFINSGSIASFSWQHHKVDVITVHIGRCRNGSWAWGQSVGTMAGTGIWILPALCFSASVYLLPPAEQIVWVAIPRLSFPKPPWFSGDLWSNSKPQAIK